MNPGVLFQIYGLAFFVLGVTAFLGINRDDKDKLTGHLGWLALFGLMHGTHEFIEGERFNNAEGWLTITSSVMMTGSYVALAEFGRHLWNLSYRSKRIAAFPLYACLGMGTLIGVVAFDPLAGVELGARYLFGFPAAVMTGLAIRYQAVRATHMVDSAVLARWLRVFAAAMLLYGLLTLFISPSSGSLIANWLPTSDDFAALVGLPVQSFRILCATLLIVAVVRVSKCYNAVAAQTLRRVTDNLNGFVYRCLNNRQWTVTFMSEGGEKLTGYPTSEFLLGERHFADLIHPDDQSRVWNEIQRSLSESNEFQLQYRMIDSVGVTHWCYEVGRGVFDGQGQLLYLEGVVRNDDERVRLESEQLRMQQLVDGSPVGIGWADIDGTPRYLNSALRKLLEVPRDSKCDDFKLRDFYDDLSFQKIENTVLPTVKKEGAWSGEIELCSLTGQKIPTLHSVFALYDKQAEVVAFANVVADLSEIRVAQHALKQERDFAKRLLQTAPAIVLLLDEDGVIEHVNPFFELLTGYDQHEVIGKEWFETCLPEKDRSQIRELFGTAINDTPVRGNINAIIAKDGSEYLIEWHAVVLYDPGGGERGLLSIGIDVTEREQLQSQILNLNKSLESKVQERTAELSRELQNNLAILDTANDGFFCADSTGRVRQANKAFSTMLGYDQDQLLTMSIPDFEASESPDETAAHIEKVISKGHDRFDTQHRRKDNSIVDVEVSVSLVEIANEKLFYAFVRDIGWRKAAESALRQARDQARFANDAKSEFLSRMSHELRSPLNAIIGFSQLLQFDVAAPLTDQQNENVSEILNAGTHLNALVNEMLDLASAESGQMEIRLEPVDLLALIKLEMTAIGHMADKKNIEVLLQESENFSVLADPMRLHQVVSNFLSNAVKFNRDQGRVEIECRRSGESCVRVCVRDTGFGLDAEQLGRLFKPFEKMQSAYQGIDGAGVGLALVKKLIERMHGAVGAESVPGEGSTFWFELPIHSAISDEPEPRIIEELQTKHDISTFKVLCIEDNSANLRLIQKMIARRADIELLSAVNAEDGLKLAVKEQPSLVLMDINLPGMDGFEALRQMRSEPLTRAIPVVAVTANAMKRDIDLGKAAGFQDYLVKPINMHDLFNVIDRHLRSGEGSA